MAATHVTISTDEYLTLCRAATMYVDAVDADMLSESVAIADLVPVEEIRAAVRPSKADLFRL